MNNRLTGALLASLLTTGAYAQNDDCAGALSLVAGVPTAFDTSAATTSVPAWACAIGGNDLWYRYTTSASGTGLRVTTCGSSYDTALELFSGTCAGLVQLGCNDDACALQSTLQVGGLTPNTPYYVRVGGYNGATGLGTLVLTETLVPPPPAPPVCPEPADMFEPNDSCGQTVTLFDGLYTGLNIDPTNNDFYSITVPAGSTVVVNISFSDAEADLDLYLWDHTGFATGTAACGTAISGTGAAVPGTVAIGYSASDNESCSWVNATGTAVALTVEVDWFAVGLSTCNTYNLAISGTGSGAVGTPFCNANNNSTGSPSILTANQPPVVGDTTLELSVDSLPNNTFGFFVMAAGTTAETAVSQGHLCLAAPVYRYQLTVLNSGASGAVSMQLFNVPLPTPIVVGQTWHFQYWHRDSFMGQAVSNFSEGRTLTFQ